MQFTVVEYHHNSAGAEYTVELDVEFEPGWYRPANFRGNPDNWCPEEGEDPEINSIREFIIDKRGNRIGEGKEIPLHTVEREWHRRIAERAWRYQQRAEKDACVD